MPLRSLLAYLLLLWSAPAVHAQLAVTGYSPASVAPGKTTELTLTGQNLTDPLTVWTSFSAQVEVLPGEPTIRKIKVTLPADASLGIAALVVANGGGVSGPHWLTIDDLPAAPEAANNSLAAAQEVTPPIAIEGVASGQQSDFYAVTLAAGQKIAIEVVGARLGSDFDPVLRVLDAQGRELALADDDDALGADPRLYFTSPAAGKFVLEVRDNRYRAGGRYRLRIGDFPLVAAALPCGGLRGAGFDAALIGIDGESIPTRVGLPAGLFDVSQFVSARRPGGLLAGCALLRASDFPSLVEIEAASSTPTGQPLTAPAAIPGRLTVPKQRDRYMFAARKGERWNFAATSRSLQSPAVLAMRVLNAADAPLAGTTPTELEEETLPFTAPEDGNYRLEVEDLLGRGGPTFVYRVEATQGPLFNLVFKNDPATRFQHVMAPGGAQFVDLQVQRNGYDGPIDLAPVASRPGFRLFPATIPAGVNELRVYLLPPDDFHPGELIDLHLDGKANVGLRVHRCIAQNRVQLRAARPLLPYPPSWLEGTLLVGFADQAAFYTVAPAAAEVTVPIGGAVMLPFSFARTDANFKDVPLTLQVYGLPTGVTVEMKRNGNGPQETYEATFKAAAATPEGKHSVHWFAYAEFNGRGRVLQGDATLMVAKPAQ